MSPEHETREPSEEGAPVPVPRKAKDRPVRYHPGTRIPAHVRIPPRFVSQAKEENWSVEDLEVAVRAVFLDCYTGYVPQTVEVLKEAGVPLSERRVRQLLVDPEIRAAIEERAEEAGIRLLPGVATPHEVQVFLTRTMRLGETEKNQLRAADLLAKVHGLYTENRNVQHSAKGGLLDLLRRATGEAEEGGEGSEA